MKPNRYVPISQLSTSWNRSVIHYLIACTILTVGGVADGDVLLNTNFEDSSSLPSGWSENQTTGTATWKIQSGGGSAGGSNPTTAHGGTNNATLFSSTKGYTTRLITPTFSTAAYSNLSLTFWHTQAFWSPDQDELKVLYSSDGGTTWTQLAYYTSDVATWTQRTLSIPVASLNTRIAFEGIAKYGYGVCLDDIQVTGDVATTSQFSVSATDAAASEAGQDPGTWTITRIGNTTSALAVNFTLSGTATAGSDYNINATSPINFAAGETSKVITLTPVDDTASGEGVELATLTLTTGTGYTIGTAAANISIADNDGYDLNILVIGSTHSFSEDGESGAVQEAAFNPTTIATNLKNMLLADPANTDTVNVAFEDVYRTSLQPVITGGNGNTVYTEANATWMTFECHTLAQYFMWPDGKAARMTNLRGQAGTQWDYIVIVEDPYVLANFPGMYAEAAKLFHEEISKGAGELVLMSQWPKVGSTFTATAFNEHSFRVGKSLDVKVAPAAKAWNDLTSKDTSANHPTPNGAYLAAASLYSTLTTRNATSFVTGASNQSLTQLAYNTVQTTNSTAQYSGIYSEPNKFQMKYNRKRLLIGTQQGTSTERGIWYDGILRAAHAAGVSFTIPAITSVGPLPVDFNLGRGYLGVEKYYIVDPTKYSSSYGFPTGDNSQTKGAETMRYGIDKRNVSGTYDQNTDLGIAYNMLRQGEVEPSYDVRAIPMRLLWSKLYHYYSTIPAYDDLWHLSTQVNRAAGGFLFTLNSGRCPIGDEPAPQGSTAWQQWLGLKIGYETAWQMSHMTSRVPGFRVIPTTNKPETGYVVTPNFSQGLSVKFIYPPKSNVTVNVSVSDAAAGTVSTNSLTFTPQNYNVPQIVTVTGVNRENGEFPFNVILTTSSTDVVYDGHRDEWDYKNNVVASTGSVLIGGWEGPRPFTPDQAIVSDVNPKRLSNTPLQSPTLEDNVSAVLTVNNGAILGSSGAISHPANQRYLWGTANLDVKPNDVTSTIVYRLNTSYLLTLTVTNNHPTKDLRMDAIHWIISRTSEAPTQVTVSYASGNLSDATGASTVVTLTTGTQHNVNLSTLLTDRVLSSGQSATFTWTPDPSQFTGANPTLSVDNFAISGNLISSAPDNAAPTPNPMSWASVPTAVNSSSITMTATTASDPSGVEYYFTETSGNPGGSDSGWQDSASYTDSGLTANTTYTYTVTARDKAVAMNTTVVSASASATTSAASNPVNAGTSTVVASTASVPANNSTTSTITVTLKDAGGTPVSGKTVSLSGNASATIQTSNNTSNASGVVTFTVKSSTVGTETFSATGDSITITQTANVQFTTVVPPASPAEITWSVHTITGNISEVSNAGTKVIAASGADGGATADVVDGTVWATVNGVAFTDAFTMDSPSNKDTLGSRANASVSGEYYKMLQFADRQGSGLATWTFNGLTIGNTYQIQIWAQDNVSTAGNVGHVLNNGGINTPVLNSPGHALIRVEASSEGSPGQYALGTFVANATTQQFQGRAYTNLNTTPIVYGGITINAYQLRDLGAPVNTFTSWISGYNVGAQTAFSDDPDQDGVANGIERYFGSNPGEHTVGMLMDTVNTGAGTFTFTHPISDNPASDLTAAYRWSKNLTNYYYGGQSDPAATTVTFAQGIPSGGRVSVTATITGTITDKIFFDIEVTQN